MAQGRGLSGVRLVTDDKCTGMPDALEEAFRDPLPAQRVHFCHNVLRRAPVARRKAAARMAEGVHARESREACLGKAAEVVGEPESIRPEAAAWTVHDGFAETLAHTDFPPERWRRIGANNGVRRINSEVRRRPRTVGAYFDDNFAFMSVTAKLKYILEHE